MNAAERPLQIRLLYIQPPRRSGGYQLARQTVVSFLCAGWKRDLLVGRQVALRLMISDVTVQTQQEVVRPAQGPQPVQVLGQRPIVEVVL